MVESQLRWFGHEWRRLVNEEYIKWRAAQSLEAKKTTKRN
jgi:hypothetical protein